MAKLQLAVNYIESMGAVGLHYGHLQLVYKGQEIEVQAPYTSADWAIGSNITFAYPPAREHADADQENTTGTDEPGDKYQIIDVDIGDRDPDHVWDLLLKVHQKFVEDQPDYLYGLGQNSNSYINTLLWMIGIDVQSLIPLATPDDVIGPDPFGLSNAASILGAGILAFEDLYEEIPGSDRNILTDGYGVIGQEITFSLSELEGTDGDDFLQTGDGDDSFSAGNGDDNYSAGDGDDILIGGRGNDVLNGGNDFDTAEYAQIQDHSVDDRNQGIVATMNATKSGTVDDGLGGMDVLSAIEMVSGTTFDDVYIFQGILASLSSSDPLQFDGNNGVNEVSGDTIDLSEIEGSGVKIVFETEDDFGFVTGASGGADNSTDAQIVFANIENATGSGVGDTIIGGSGRNILRGGEGGDTIDGGEGHDEIHGGTGSDDLQGGDGADWIFDRGADYASDEENETPEQYEARLFAYDGTGNDTVEGGAGSDILVYSGGTDTFYGGAGNDIYMAVDNAVQSENDKLTIVLQENSGDPDTYIGHDLIDSDNSSVNLVKFEGISSSDVTFKYNYSASQTGTGEYYINPWLDPIPFEIYSTVGTVEIIVNATGSSLTVQNVHGHFYAGEDGIPVGAEAGMGVPFMLEFDDGLVDWPTQFLDPSTNYYTFENSTLSSNAFAALGALEAERSVPTQTIEGELTASNELYGSIESEILLGGNLADVMYGGGANDVMIGGEDADYLDGGSGQDTASYENATSGVRVSVAGALSGATGEEVGDTLVSIENLTGSDFDDVLVGDDQDNVLRGGAGNDILETQTGYDGLYGGDGDDLLINAGYVWQPDGSTTIHESGNGIYDGGAGIDTFETQTPMDAVIDLTTGQAVWAESGDEVQLVSIENVNAGSGDDVITGNAVDNVLNGGDGNDVIHGGGGDDALIGGSGENHLHGGTGVDTAKINALSTMVSYEAVDGGIRVTIDTTHPDYVSSMDDGSFIIGYDVEFIEFNDSTISYADIAGSILTEFGVNDDYFRVDEGGSDVVDVVANDLGLTGDPVSVVTVGGTAMSPGSSIRLNSGATLTLLADGTLEFDQGGAYAWLEPGQTVTEVVTYTATDSTGVEKTGSITLVVDGAASNPDALHLEQNVFLASTDPDNATETRIANFNIATSLILVDEIFVNPNNPAAHVTIQEINGDTHIMFGGDDAIVLEDISLEAWKHAADNNFLPTPGADNFTGTSGDDILIGDGGSDWLTGDDGDDLLLGGQGDDTLSGGNGRDELQGGSGNDKLYGGDGDDILAGGDGDDYFTGGLGQDIFDGGDGFDTVALQQDDVPGENPGVYVDLNAGIIQWQDNPTDLEQLVRIEAVHGTGGEDVLIGDDGNNRLDGVGGNDILRGGGGDDTLTDGYGDNALYGGAGDDVLVVTGSGSNQLFGEDGNDTLTSGKGVDTLSGGAGNDLLKGREGDDVYLINLGDGNDVIHEGYGNSFGDRIVFGEGITSDMIALSVSDADGDGYDNVVLSISGTSQTVTIEDAFFTSGGNNQAVEFMEFADGTVVDIGALYSSTRYAGTSGDDSYAGTGLSETMYGLLGDDYLFGDAGNDTLFGGEGNDEVRGGVGDDTHYGEAGDDLIVAWDGNDWLSGGSGNDELNGNDGNDQLYGDEDNDVLNGGDGDDDHFGGAGDDLLIANIGDDSFDGGEGNDTIDFTYTSNNVALDLSAGTATFEGGGQESMTNIENVIGGSGNNRITGTSGSNVIDGQVGHDTLIGGAGTDTLTGGTDWDIFEFSDGDGQDTVTDFDPNSDFIVINGMVFDPSNPPAGISVSKQGQNALISYGVNDTILLTGVSVSEWTGIARNGGNDVLTGTTADETFYGGSGNDTIDGGDGDDNHFGGTGNDHINGSLGYDFFDGGDGDDTIDFSYTSTNFAMNLSQETVVFEDGHTEQVLNFENIIGGSGNDVLTGSDGNNQISGGAGDDIVDGLAGEDIYDYALGDGNDTIRDGGTNSAEIDVLRFGAGILPDEVTVALDGDNIVLTITATGETVTLENSAIDALASVDEVQFDDGTTWDHAELLLRSDPAYGNNAPTVVDDAASVAEDGSVLIDVLANDSDVDGDTLTITDVTGATNGTVSIEAGQIRYTPNADFNGTETLTYTVDDGLGGTGTASVTVTVTSQNDAPLSQDDVTSIAEDGTILIDVLANDSDVDGDALTITAVTGATNGTAVIEAGQIRYTPGSDFNGSETLTYTVADGNGGTTTATVSITVTPVNDAPIAVDDSASLAPDGTVLIDVLANDSDAEGDALTLTAVSGATNGTAAIEAGQIRYTPNAGFSGNETLTYTVDDGNGGVDTATVTVTVTAGNVAPVAVDDTASLTQDGTVLIDVLANDGDANGDTLTITDVTGAANGTAAIEAGQIRYTPNAGFTGSETLTYTVDDGNGGVDTATVTVTITTGNVTPVAVDDTASLTQDGTVLIDVLANDSDADGDTLTITDVTEATNGTASLEAGQIRYTPNAGFSGTDTISYTISDGAGGTATASVQIDVTAVPNGAPIVVDDYVTVVSGGIILIDALANDSDSDGGYIYISSVAPTIAKSLQFVDGKIEYGALDNYTGVVEMDYTVSDFDGNSTTGTVFIDVVAPNSGPIANNDTASVDENDTVLIDVLANDDAGGGTLSISSITAALNGTAVIEAGQIRYTPNTDYFGTDTISYTISDGAGGTATASVQIDVAEVQEGAPIVVDDYVTVESGGTILIDALANDSDPDGDGIYISNVAPTTAQSIQFVDGKIQYQALDNYTGVVEMVYTVTDFGGTSSTGSVFIDVVASVSSSSFAEFNTEPTISEPVEVMGTDRKDRLVSTEVDEIMTGGARADVFVFNALEPEGTDQITDFELDVDTIELAGSTYAELVFSDTGSGTQVEWGSGSVDLLDIALASLTEDQFSFV